jgi:hypothetical protein
MQYRFPYHDEAWRRQVEALILGLEHDVQSIQKTMPMTPDPEAGVAFTGPLSPKEFNFPKRAEQSGTPATT